MAKIRIIGATSPEVSKREIKHRELARQVATEGIVLLKNDGVLPLETRQIAIYGPGSSKEQLKQSDMHKNFEVRPNPGMVLDEFTVYNKALSPAEIKALYESMKK